MPYITQVNRLDFEAALYEVPEDMKAGDLNYLLTSILLKQNPKNYTDYNKLIGVLECCKLEFYRRAISAYEDEKITQNGDVFPQWAGSGTADWRNGSDGEGQ